MFRHITPKFLDRPSRPAKFRRHLAENLTAQSAHAQILNRLLNKFPDALVRRKGESIMYELVQAGPQSFYLNAPAKIGIYLADDTHVYLIDS